MKKGLATGFSKVSIGLAGIAGASVALGFSDFHFLNNVRVPYAIHIFYTVQITAVVVSPFLAGWQTQSLKNALLYPIGVLVCVSVVWAIGEPPPIDALPIVFLIVITVGYGGVASVAFFTGWKAGQWLHRTRYR